MAIDVLYFAWLRERIGHPRERIETGAATVRELIAQPIIRREYRSITTLKYIHEFTTAKAFPAFAK